MMQDSFYKSLHNVTMAGCYFGNLVFRRVNWSKAWLSRERPKVLGPSRVGSVSRK